MKWRRLASISNNIEKKHHF